MKILVTGGAGYIGSHTCVELLNKGYEIVVVDNLSNSSIKALDRIKEITNRDFEFYQADVQDKEKLEDIFQKNKIDSVIHFAGLKAVGESVEKPIEYYDNNINSTLVLVQAMKKYGCKKMIFSSSATVYSGVNESPLTESSIIGNCTNPYGWTKYMIEQILKDMANAEKDMSIVLLRYFNPIGAHESGLIGEDPRGIPNNLVPYISQVAVGRREFLHVYGNDYDTPDGTGVRDYIHVVDLAVGHVCAIEYAEKNEGVAEFNLGTGTGYSVLDVVNAFEKASGVKIPYRIENRRPGDLATVYSSPEKSERELGWKARYGIEKMCEDAWNWQSRNPEGYEG